MPWIPAGSAVVVVAHQFNPPIVTQHWLLSNAILAVEDFQQGSLFSDYVVQVRSRLFHLLLVPEQLQFVPVVPAEEQQALIVERLGKIVTTLPHTPYRALGLNFSWHLTLQDGDIARATRDLFCNVDRPLYQHFNESNAHYGAYLSKDFAGFRLRLDIKPITREGEEDQESRIRFGFNFHLNIGEGGAKEIVEGLNHWNEVREETERIIDSVEARGP
jgi:hypothetical protein